MEIRGMSRRSGDASGSGGAGVSWPIATVAAEGGLGLAPKAALLVEVADEQVTVNRHAARIRGRRSKLREV